MITGGGNSFVRAGFLLAAMLVIIALSGDTALAEEARRCKNLDTREFGLVSDGSISESWSEVKLIEKYGPPCAVIYEGEVVIRDGWAEDYKLPSGRPVATKAAKKKLIYTGDSVNRTAAFTIVDGFVVKKERVD